MTRLSAHAPRAPRAPLPRPELLAAAFAALLGLSTGHASAQADATTPSSNQSTWATDVQRAVVQVDSASPDLASTAIQTAIRNELERSAAPADLEGTSVAVSVNKERLARVAVRTQRGETRSRELTLPADSGAALEVLGLVSASLVRSDADVLAEALRSRGPSSTDAIPPGGADASGAKLAPPHDKDASAKASSPAPQAKDAASDTHSKPPSTPTKPSAPLLAEAPFNLSFVHPIAILPDSDERLLRLELGAIYSRVGAINGFGGNGLVLRTQGDVNGVAAAGVWSDVGGDTTGFNVAGLFSRSRGSLEGISESGLVDLRTGSVRGGQFGGIYASNSGTEGIQVAGLLAQSASMLGVQSGGVAAIADDTTGLQVGGVGAIAGNPTGLQLGGVFAWASSVEGLQLAGVTALADDVEGAQIAGIVSSAHDVDGAQISGIVNTAHHVRGVQFGLVNVADRVDGYPVGLVNAVGNGRNQLVAWTGGERMPLNLGLKYLHGPVYTLLAIGAKPNEDDKGDIYAAGAGLGGRVNLFRDAFLELDALWMHETRFRENDEGAQVVRGRAALGYELTKKLAIFAGGGPLFFYDGNAEETGWEPHYFAGVQVF